MATDVKPTYEDYKKAMDNWTFHGTEAYHETGIAQVVCTDGAVWFIKTFNAVRALHYLIITMLQNPREHFIVMKIKADKGTAKLIFEDGNYNNIVSYDGVATELPSGEYELWAANHPNEKVVLLKTEY